MLPALKAPFPERLEAGEESAQGFSSKLPIVHASRRGVWGGALSPLIFCACRRPVPRLCWQWPPLLMEDWVEKSLSPTLTRDQNGYIPWSCNLDLPRTSAAWLSKPFPACPGRPASRRRHCTPLQPSLGGGHEKDDMSRSNARDQGSTAQEGIYGWFLLVSDGKQQSSVKQLSFN